MENDERQGHFAVLTKMNALLGRAYYCNDCDMGYNNNTQHRCKISCDLCGRNKCLPSGKIVPCDRCHAQCHLQECLAKYRLQQSGKYPLKCSTMYFCPDCKVSLKTMTWGRCKDKRNHICIESFCKNCQQYYMDDHKCYMCSTVVDKVADMKEDERECMELLGHDTSHSP